MKNREKWHFSQTKQNFVRGFDLDEIYKQTRDLKILILRKILYPEMASNQNLNA